MTSNLGNMSVAETAKLARTVFSDAGGGIKYKQTLRPYICPFHVMMNFIPSGATVLDVGCGAGLFTLMLARLQRIRSAVGFDADAAAIRAAQDIAATLPDGDRIQFVHCNAHDPWPDGRFDVVSLIDVMHHVEPDKRQEVIATAVRHLSDGGILLYKDMGSRPLWRAWANRIHDLLSVGQWISYAQLDEVIAWAQSQGLEVDVKGSLDMLWYRHEWCVFRGPAAAAQAEVSSAFEPAIQDSVSTI